MAVCKKPALAALLISVAIGAVSCTISPQHAKFQMSFLPAVPKTLPVLADLAEVPASRVNLFLAETPKFIVPKPEQPPSPSLLKADNLIERAEQRYERGRRLYSAKNTERARREFDSAIDLMLQASEAGPANRTAFERKFEGMVDTIHRFDLAGLGAAAPLAEGQFEKAPLEDILEMTFPVDPSLKNKVREQLRATVSQLPLSMNDSVLGYIQYFTGRGHRTIVAATQRSGKYRPLIKRILDEEGVPQELIHLAQAESGFMPRAMSTAKATGMWQFVQFRGQQYGLMQTPYTDDRMDPEKATRAAARHLRDLYNQFGDWYLAIAAYNCGPGTIEKAVERTGYADFWELRARRVIPAETTNYVPIILAMTLMEKNAKEYGLENPKLDPPMEYDTVEIASPTHMALVADMLDTPVSELASMNPALLKGIAPRGYALHVPKGSSNTLMASLQLIPEERRASWRVHKVESGDTLAGIGKRYGMTAGTIAAANRMSADSPIEGDRLIIPAVYKEPAAAVRKAAAARRKGAATTTSARSRNARGTATRSATAKTPVKRKQPAALSHTASSKTRRTATSN